MHVTRYKVVHRLDEKSSILVNTLSGAIDVIDNRYLPLLKDPAALVDHPDVRGGPAETGHAQLQEQREEFRDTAGRAHAASAGTEPRLRPRSGRRRIIIENTSRSVFMPLL